MVLVPGPEVSFGGGAGAKGGAIAGMALAGPPGAVAGAAVGGVIGVVAVTVAKVAAFKAASEVVKKASN